MCVTEHFYTWHSPHIGRDFHMLVFGDRGFPVVLFPTSMGTYYEAKDRGLIQEAGHLIDSGKIKVYCPESIDADSWYNKQVHPSVRAYNHVCYDKLVLHEIAERAAEETGHARIAVAGCSFGGYHAANFAFRYPDKVAYLFSMSGAFDITSRTDGYYDDNVYYNNPVDYLMDDEDASLWSMGIILGVAEHDICREQNERLSGILQRKKIPHWLDVHENTFHDWPVWREMFPRYLSRIA